MKNRIASLAKKAAHGDSAAFGELYSQFSTEMYRYALYHLGSREAALDAVQETALEAFRSIGKLRNEAAVKSWFFGILCNVCKHSLREKYKAEVIPLDLCEDIRANDSDIETALDLAQMISALDEQSREIVLLSVIAGYTSKEIAAITGSSPGTVRSRLSRTLSSLRKQMEGEK